MAHVSAAACVEGCPAVVVLQDLSGIAAAVNNLQAALCEYIGELDPVEVKFWAERDLTDDDIIRWG
jgi:hypothetical protein